MRSRAYIGTSGWNYRHWKAHFYAGVPQKDWLRHAGARFSGLEINASFYRLQKPETLRQWDALGLIERVSEADSARTKATMSRRETTNAWPKPMPKTSTAHSNT